MCIRDRLRAVALARSTSDTRWSLTSSGRSSITRCPAPGTHTRSAAGSISAIVRLWSAGVIRSLSPASTSAGTASYATSASVLSCTANAGKNSATTSIGVASISRSPNRAMPGSTFSGVPNEYRLISPAKRSAVARRPRSTISRCQPSALRTPGASQWKALTPMDGSPKPTSLSRPAEVPIRATPTTRSATYSGNWSASAITVIPPMECPTSTIGPSGTAASSTAFRSRPSRSMVTGSVPSIWPWPREERPWLRWSQWTVRTVPRSAERWKCQESWLRQ